MVVPRILNTHHGDAEDPRVGIEKLSGPGKKQLISKLDTSILRDDAQINRFSDDPLATIWTGPLFLWSPSARAYHNVPGLSVGAIG
jgi:hypothetical protein